MSRKKQKAIKRKPRKRRNKKKHLSPAVFFAVIIVLLLIVAVYCLYTYEQQKKPQQQTSELTQTQTQSQTKAKTEVKAKTQSKSKSKSQTKISATSKVPSAPRIVDYTDLEYPVSYSSQPEQIIVHTGHALSYNKNWKIPNWASYELTVDKTMGSEKRHDKFTPDPRVKEHSAIDADYRRSGYDRGHMVPAADMKWSSTAMKESFYFSNICPQDPKLNQRRWKELENKVREWAIADSAIIVICGPIVNDSPKQIGSNKVVVPHGFFKVILSPYIASPKAIGFLFENQNSTKPLRSHVVSVDSVEAVTQLDFFSTLPDNIEDILEAYVDTLYWGL